jgi:hypothetical protein
MMDGRMMTIAGNDYWNPVLGLSEGPAAFMRSASHCLGHGYSGSNMVALGVPHEGGEQDYLAVAVGGQVFKVWKNAEKGGRWWFRRIAGGGKQDLPTVRGQSIPALDAKSAVRVHAGKDGALYVNGGRGAFRLDNGTLTCVLGFDDYKDMAPKTQRGDPAPADKILAAGNGDFYVQFPSSAQPGTTIYRIPPDFSSCEPYVGIVGSQHGGGPAPDGKHYFDGPGWGAQFFCGPFLKFSMLDYRYLPPDIVMLHTADDHWMRRARDGRVSTLCADGRWRELDKRPDVKGSFAAFRSWIPGPKGTVYQIYCTSRDIRYWRLTGIDCAQPTTGTKVNGPRGDAAENRAKQ